MSLYPSLKFVSDEYDIIISPLWFKFIVTHMRYGHLDDMRNFSIMLVGFMSMKKIAIWEEGLSVGKMPGGKSVVRFPD